MSIVKRWVDVILSAVGLGSKESIKPDESAGEAMIGLRQLALTSSAKESGAIASKEFARTFAVLIDLPVGDHTASIFAHMDGTTSLYLTSGFGIIGRGASENVRAAGAQLIAVADGFFDAAKPTETSAYPMVNKVLFYLMTFDGLRVIEEDLNLIETNQSEYMSFFERGQEVLTLLRMSVDKE